jgi:hypothetical protein
LPSINNVFTAVVVLIVILGGVLAGIFVVLPRISSPNGTTTSSSSSSNHVTTTTTSTTTTSTSTSTTQSSANVNYGLSLITSGATGPAVNSSLTTFKSMTRIPCDYPTCSASYNDNGYQWILDGDFNPGLADFNANSSGLTLINHTCDPTPTTNITNCGPYHEAVGDRLSENETTTQVTAYMNGISTNLDLFSINLNIPDYSSIFSTCIFNQSSSSGCSYESPYSAGVIATFALTVSGTYANGSSFSNTIAINGAETGLANNPTYLSFAALAAEVTNGKYIATINLANTHSTVYTPGEHTFTIATDWKTYLEMFVDNNMIYSSNTIPIYANGISLSPSFYQFTDVNNETISTTWSNFRAYSSSAVTVIGLSSGMEVVVTGPGGFLATAVANSSGVAVVEAPLDPLALSVSITLNGATVATYQGSVGVGAELEVVTH